MRIRWEGLSSFIREMLPQQGKTSGGGSQPAPQLPSRFVALVRDIKKEHVLLRWEGQEITVKVNIPVKRGEYLLLQYREFINREHHYRVLARSFEPIHVEGDRGAANQHLLIPTSREIPVPLMFRYYLDPEQEKGQKEKEKKEGKKRPAYGRGGLLFDFILETPNLGLIIIRLQKEDACYLGKLLLESEDSGKLIQKNLRELQEILSSVVSETGVYLQMLGWEVIPAAESDRLKKSFSRMSALLDRRV